LESSSKDTANIVQAHRKSDLRLEIIQLQGKRDQLERDIQRIDQEGSLLDKAL